MGLQDNFHKHKNSHKYDSFETMSTDQYDVQKLHAQNFWSTCDKIDSLIWSPLLTEIRLSNIEISA